MSYELSSSDLQYMLRSNMGFAEYSFCEFYQLYLEILNRDRLINIEPLSKIKFRRKLQWYTSVDGSWLIKRGAGKKAVYYRRMISTCSLSFKELRKIVRGWINSIDEKIGRYK